MAKLVVQHDEDPGIAIVLEHVPPRTPGRAQGWHGACTQCGHVIHRWYQDGAFESAKEHVDRHESTL